MIKEFFLSFTDNIKKKTTNPFFGTLIIVWLIHNYQNIYGLVWANSNISYSEKIKYLDNMFSSKAFSKCLLECILISLAALVISYLLLNLSRLIVNFYEKIVSPYVYKLFDKTSIVLKTDFDSLAIERDRIQKRFEEERNSRLKMQGEIESLENQIKQLVKNEPRIESIKNGNNENKYSKILDLIKERDYINDFENIIYLINTSKFTSEKASFKFFVTIGLIQKDKTHAVNPELFIYKFTGLGLDFQSYYRENYLFQTK